MSADSLYLSPHLDDVILSCGGQICKQVQEGRKVLVVTVFAGAPPEASLSPFAAEMHVRWSNTTSPIAARRQEDRTAMDILGAETLHLEYPDAIYRFDADSYLYLSDDDLFAALHPSDLALVHSVAASIAELCSTPHVTIYAPLAVGNHVDHQLTRAAILTLDPPPSRVLFYEDFPYAENRVALTQALQALGEERLAPELEELDEACLGAKIEAISAYRSQLATLFDTDAPMSVRVEEYARAVGSGHGLAERYWRMTGRDGRSQRSERTAV